MRRHVLRALGALATSAALGCAALSDPTSSFVSLEESQHSYTKLVRWGEIERASAYVAPELRDEFRSHAPDFASIRVTDFEIGSFDPGDEEGSISVTVTYSGYSIATLLEKSVQEQQDWYREESSGAWRVRPGIEAIVAAFADSKP